LAWRFRKSARLPLGFRLNASKSGLGFSWGFRGFRIGRDAKGRTVRTLSLPGTGVFNRQVISTARSRATFVTVNSCGVGYQRRTENLEPGLQPENDPQLQLDSVFHVPVSELAASNQSEFVARLNDNVSAFNPGRVLIALSVFALLLVSSNFILGLVLFLLGLGLGIFISKRFAESHTDEINFSLDQESAEQFRARQQALSVLSSCARIWVVNTSASNADAKRNAGAYTLISRGPAAVGNLPTKGFKCSLPIPSIRANNIVLHFLPDQILIYTGRYGSISYAQLLIEVRSTRFSETKPIPGDSRRIDTTWQYVNKSGGPDRRFNNNRQIPVLEYGEVTFRTATGLGIILQTSNSEKAKAFAGQFSAVLPSNLVRPVQATVPPLASLPSPAPLPIPIPQTRSNPVETPLSPVQPNLQGELHPSTSDLDTISVEVNTALNELSVPLKEELRQYRLAGSARDLLDGEISRMITRTGFDGTRYSARAVDLSMSLKRQAHPKSMHFLQRDALALVMDEMIQKNRDFYLPQKMKPDILRYFQSYDGKHGTQFAAHAAELFLKVAAAAATENDAIPEAKRIILEQLTLVCRS
jgi:hypothetical protein